MVNIESGLTHADAKMTAGFAAVAKGADRQITAVKEAMNTARNQIRSTIGQHKEESNEAIQKEQESLILEMTKNRDRADGVSAGMLVLMCSREQAPRSQPV